MLQIDAEQSDDGIFQFPIPSFSYVSADFFVTSGVAQLIAPIASTTRRTSFTRRG